MNAVSGERGALLVFPFSGQNKQKVLEDWSGPKAMFGRYCPVWESMLAERGPFFLGANASIADVVVFEVMDMFKVFLGEEQFATSFAPFPKLLAMHAAVRGLG